MLLQIGLRLFCLHDKYVLIIESKLITDCLTLHISLTIILILIYIISNNYSDSNINIY